MQHDRSMLAKWQRPVKYSEQVRSVQLREAFADNTSSSDCPTGVPRRRRPGRHLDGTVGWAATRSCRYAPAELRHEWAVLEPGDVLRFLHSIDSDEHFQPLLFANHVPPTGVLASDCVLADALAVGVPAGQAPHDVFSRHRSAIERPIEGRHHKLLRQLVAVYEGRVLAQLAVWGIESLDQRGVGLGRVLTSPTGDEPHDSSDARSDAYDSSTAAAVRRYPAVRA